MKLDVQTHENSPITTTVGITISAHNAVQLADRVLRDGRTPCDGIFRRSGSTFFGVAGEADDLHYADPTLPSIEDRVQFLERLVESAEAHLQTLDPEGLVRLRIAARFDRMAAALASVGSVERRGNNLSFHTPEPNH